MVPRKGSFGYVIDYFDTRVAEIDLGDGNGFFGCSVDKILTNQIHDGVDTLSQSRGMVFEIDFEN